MKLCNETITLLIPWIDGDGYDAYTPYKIVGVSWYAPIAVNVSDKGLTTAKQVVVRIPLENAGVYGTDWRIVDGMTIVKGDCGHITPQQALEQYGEDNVFRVTAHTDNTRARAPHWKVVGR